MIKNIFLLLLFGLFLGGCTQEKPATVIKSPQALREVKCMRLVVFPPDEMLTQELSREYRFQTECPYRLEASRRSAIKCNSPYNSAKKLQADFPSGYLRLDLYNAKHRILYSYYKDLTHAAKEEDIAQAFNDLKSNLPQE